MQARTLNKPSLYLLIFTDSFFNMATLVLVPIFAVYVISLGGDVRNIGELYAIHAVSFGIIGWFVTKFFLGKRRYIAIAYFLWMCYSLVLIFNDSLTTFYCLQVIAGAATATHYPFLQLNITDHTKHAEQAQYYKTLYIFFGRLAGAVITILAAHYAHHRGFQGIFITMTILSFIAMIVAIYYARHLKSNSRSTP